MEYLDLPEIGGVCEISHKEREGASSLRLEAPHVLVHTLCKSYNTKWVRQCPRCSAVHLSSKCSFPPSYNSRFLLTASFLRVDARSFEGRALSPPQQRQQPLQL